ncbi:RNA exonuclease 3 [Lambiella insularis]|nr:RNA exonuclease 3 [Lambiella insularis]
MFSTAGLFQNIKCPEIARCQLPNCLFRHDNTVRDTLNQGNRVSASRHSAHDFDTISAEPRPIKKRRLGDNHELGEPRPEVPRESSGTGFATNTTKTATGLLDKPPSHHGPDARVLLSATKDVSPPPIRKRPVRTVREPASAKSSGVPHHNTPSDKENANNGSQIQETLNPRMLKKSPASHAVRFKLLTLLHEQIVRLNKEVQACEDPSKNALELSPQELITTALDEEYKAARDNPKVYDNVLKLRVVALKRMNLDRWKEERLKQIGQDFPELHPAKAPSPLASLATGLSSIEEIALLPKLIAKQDTLSKHGYVTKSPSDAEVEQARRGVEASQWWELCDRCKSRFQVFPGRRAIDGALTTGGKCTYHFGKPRRPIKERAEPVQKDTVYLCCGQLVGTPGCTTAESHVFKVSEAKRLALIMPFKETTVKGSSPPESAVCFDCEMGYTTYGLELIRLTATAWPDGKELLDVLVRPLGEILDLNSRFSGVWPTDFSNAVPYSSSTSISTRNRNTEGLQRQLLKVDSPAEARELLFSHLTTTTPLIGHALENDLNSARIIHPTIIDTVLLYPHPRGLPIRHGLKMLVKKHLDRDIQMGGAQGHDSKEDAMAAGDLVRLKVMETWKGMQAEGWRVKNGDFYPPLPGGPPPAQGTRIIQPGPKTVAT